MQALFALTTAVWLGATAADNTVFREMIEQGVPISGGRRVKLAPPVLPDGLDAAAQRSAIAKVIAPRYAMDDFLRDSQVAPVAIDVRSAPSPATDPPALADFYCVLYSDWGKGDAATFLEGLLQPGHDSTSTRDFLTPQQLAQRKIELVVKPDLQSRIFFTRDRLFDKVEWRTTRICLVNGDERSVIVAVALDSRFDHDREFPNQWRSITRDEAGTPRLGPPHPYAGIGFYAKATRLVEPPRAAFLECHIVLDEPREWFDGANFLRSKLPLLIMVQVHTLRWKLRMTGEAR